MDAQQLINDYLSAGGTINYIPPFQKGQIRNSTKRVNSETIVIYERRGNCKRCQTYTSTKGYGNKNCLKCKDQPALKPLSIQNYDIKPQSILEQVADCTEIIDMAKAIKLLSLPLAACLLLSVFSRATSREIGKLLNMSHVQVTKNIRKACNIIKLNLNQVTRG